MTGDRETVGTKGGGIMSRAKVKLVSPSGQPLCTQTWSWLVCGVEIL